jgi:hypothetical protein
MINNTVPFPKHDIDPKLKDEAWCLQAGKAIMGNWAQGMPAGSIFYAKQAKYNEIDDYFLNLQSRVKYMTWQTGEEAPTSSFINIDQSTDAIVKTHIQKILGRLKKINYNICATPIDALAKGKLDDYFAEKKIKIMLRQAMMQQDPNLAQHPQLAKESGDADDVEELQMQMEFSPKFVRAKEAEQGINMIFYENEFDKVIDLVDESLVNKGVAVIKEGIDSDNRCYVRFVNPGNFICSYSDDGNFDNITNAGELTLISLSELSSKFSAIDLEQIAKKCLGQNGNPLFIGSTTSFNNAYDPFKALVLDFEIISYDLKVTELRTNSMGNLKVSKTTPDKLGKDTEQKKYNGKNYEVIYMGKYIVDTDYIYDFGLKTNTKRSMDKKKVGKTNLSYHPIAASFNKMRAKGITEDLIPIADEIQMVTYRMKNANNRMIMNGLSIDFSALENVALGGSGDKQLSPAENIDMLLQTGIIGYRGDLLSQEGKNQRKAVEPLVFDYLNQFTALANYKQQLINSLYDVSGLNQSDAASVNPKMLVGVVNAQNEGTNNALFFIENARRKLVEKAARNSIPNLQTALLMGPYEGYIQTLGKTTTDFMRFEEENLPYDYDIIIEDRPTEDQKQLLMQTLQLDVQAGYLDTSDVFTISNTYNIKDAQMILSYKVKKAKELQQQNSMQQQQQNGQLQQQSNQMTAQLAAQNLQLEYSLKQKLTDLEYEWQYKIEQLKLSVANDHKNIDAATKLLNTSIVEGNKQQMANPQATSSQMMGMQQQESPQQEQAEPQQEPAQQEMAEQ